MKNLLKILKISVIVSLVIALLDATFNGFSYKALADWENLAMYFFYSFVLTTINILYFYYFNKKVGWKDAGLKRTFIASSGSIILTLLGYFLCRLIDKTVFDINKVDCLKKFDLKRSGPLLNKLFAALKHLSLFNFSFFLL